MDSRRGLDRFVTFLDAIVAIAVTLLILPLVDVAGEVDKHQPLGDVLSDHASQIGGFFLSFIVIARLWRSHHAITQRLATTDPWIMRLGILWVLTIVILPFPTQLIATYDNERSVASLYIGVQLLSTLCLAATAWRVYSVKSLQAGAVKFDTVLPSLSITICMALALVMCLLVKSAGVWTMFLLFLATPLSMVIKRVHERNVRTA